MMRSPVSLTRLRFTPGAREVVYARKGGHDASEPGEDETVDADEFVARVLVQIPDPRRHLVRYYGAYSNREGAAPKGAEPARWERLRRGCGACPPAAGTGGPEAPLGQSHPAGVRSGPARVSSVWRRHPRPHPQARQGLSPSSATPGGRGAPRLRVGSESHRSEGEVVGQGPLPQTATHNPPSTHPGCAIATARRRARSLTRGRPQAATTRVQEFNSLSTFALRASWKAMLSAICGSIPAPGVYRSVTRVRPSTVA